MLDGSLIINVTEHPELLSGKYSLTLSEIGFEKSPIICGYILDDDIKIRSNLQDIINYFKRKGFEVQVNDDLTELKDSLVQEEKIFEQSKVLGTKVKNNETEKISEIPFFKRQLKEYQEKAVKHLIAVNNGANFSVPGSGKTTMLYAAYAIWKSLNEVEKLLVIGPPSSFMAWEEEYTECFGKEPVCYRLIGSDREQKYRLVFRAELLLTTFQTATLDVDKLIRILKQHKVMLIIDESHYIKRFENGIWASAILRMAPYAKHRAISTGTPMPNSLLDLYSQLTFLWPSKQLLGEQNFYKAEVKRRNSSDWVRERISPFFYRIKKSDLGLPEPQTHIIDIPMSKYQEKIYRALAARTLNEIELLSSKEISELRKWRKAKIVRLMQASTNPGLLCHYSNEFQVPPLQADGLDLVEIIENYNKIEKPQKIIEAVNLAKRLIENGHKVILWSTFINNILALKNDFVKEGITVYTIFGAVPKDDEENEDFNREQQIKAFKKGNEPSVLLANPAACAESISLHKECHHAIYLDRSFNCGRFIQSMDRIHRIGLDKNQETHYYFLQSTDTIDVVINSRLNEKAISMYKIIESDMPVGSQSLDGEDWEDEDELLNDFNAVISQLRGMGLQNEKVL
jgi:SNF2 family DNA or RNA helicase